MPSEPRRILIIQLKRIGDVVLTTPMASALRESIPGCRLAMAIDAGAMGLASSLPVDEVLVFDRGLAGGGFWRSLIFGNFDICLDPTGTDRSALASFLSGAPSKITFERFKKKPLRARVFDTFVDSSVRSRHTIDHHLDLLGPLGIEPKIGAPRLDLPVRATAEAAAVLQTRRVEHPFAVVHPGTARAEKFWTVAGWADAINHLRSKYKLPVVITGGKGGAERAHIDAILEHVAHKEGVSDCAGALSLAGTAALIREARIVCSVDSAPVHLASAVGTPVVALYGPTNPYHWHPRNVPARILTPDESGSTPTAGYRGSATAGIQLPPVLNAIDSLLQD